MEDRAATFRKQSIARAVPVMSQERAFRVKVLVALVAFCRFFTDMYLAEFYNEKDDFTAISSALRQYLPEKDTPYILDVDLDFFSTKNPFKNLHERVNLYDKLAPLFTYKRTESNDPEVSLF
ncbi:hypothetical protein ALC53_00275 [Atta colombica]|uniref:Uncharacterized protein n=1 Tax=Atta colombica TaxID=520822 RepID=A0A195BZK2_9HYME|nr:hypothetical protein ALC53_00275 [Atta colombica]